MSACVSLSVLVAARLEVSLLMAWLCYVVAGWVRGMDGADVNAC